MYRNILVPLDGSSFAEQAIPVAVNLARRSGGSVTLARVHVSLAPAFAHGLPPFDYELERGAREQVRAYIEPLARRFEGNGVTVRPLTLDGAVIEALCDHVSSHDTDLVVLSTHGRGPLARFWLGSVADELIRKLTVPVLTVRPREEPDAKPAPAFRHILVPLDGSELAESILEPAIELGTASDAEYTLLRVLAPPTPPVGTADLGGAFMDYELLRRLHELEENEGREADQHLRATAARLSARSLNVGTRLVRADPAALTILAQARDLKADAIAIASHGRGGMARLLLGSVADKILRGATMPVLLCHPTEMATAEEPVGAGHATAGAP